MSMISNIFSGILLVPTVVVNYSIYLIFNVIATIFGRRGEEETFIHSIKSHDLSNKIVIVTGSNTGIGERTAGF